MLPSECTSTRSIKSVSSRFRLRSTEKPGVGCAEVAMGAPPSANSFAHLADNYPFWRWPRNSGPRRSSLRP